MPGAEKGFHRQRPDISRPHRGVHVAPHIDRNQHGLDTGIAGGHEKVETRQRPQGFLVADGIARELPVDIGSLPKDYGLGRFTTPVHGQSIGQWIN